MKKGQTGSTLSSLLDYAVRGHSPDPTYLSGCGVLEAVCFLQGLTTASYLTDGISSTLSFYINHQSQELHWEI